MIDAKVAHACLERQSLRQDRRTALDLLPLKETLHEESSNALCRWLAGTQHVADGLTKEKGNGVLEAVRNGSLVSV